MDNLITPVASFYTNVDCNCPSHPTKIQCVIALVAQFNNNIAGTEVASKEVHVISSATGKGFSPSTAGKLIITQPPVIGAIDSSANGELIVTGTTKGVDRHGTGAIDDQGVIAQATIEVNVHNISVGLRDAAKSDGHGTTVNRNGESFIAINTN